VRKASAALRLPSSAPLSDGSISGACAVADRRAIPLSSLAPSYGLPPLQQKKTCPARRRSHVKEAARESDMTTSTKMNDFRQPTASKKLPRAVADAGAGIIIAVADIDGPPERVFDALTTDEVVKWWKNAELYRTAEFKADRRVCGAWSQLVQLNDGNTVIGSGEFAELDRPRKVVMTRRFDKHPFQGQRETTITFRFDPVATGTRVTVRDEGFIGRSEAAYGNAEIWEKVLGWLDEYIGLTEGAAR